MDRLQLLDAIGHSGESLRFACMGVNYRFDFCARSHQVGARTLYELGRVERGDAIVLEPVTKNVICLVEEGPAFMNSSFRQLVETTLEALSEMALPADAAGLKRAAMFKRRMEQIDANCFHSRDAFWTPLLWEIEYGVL